MPDRRHFFGALLTGLAASPLRALTAAPAREEWDLRWLRRLRGEHRQVFDLQAVADNPLRVVRNWLNGHHAVFGLRDTQLNAVVGIASRAFPLNAGDALWAKYGLGERYQLRDPSTGEWARQNTFVHVATDAPGYIDSVPALTGRGVVFWMCNNTLLALAQRFAPVAGQTAEATYQELRSGLLPHVKVVPSHTMLIGLCQEQGCTYEVLV